MATRFWIKAKVTHLGLGPPEVGMDHRAIALGVTADEAVFSANSHWAEVPLRLLQHEALIPPMQRLKARVHY